MGINTNYVQDHALNKGYKIDYFSKDKKNSTYTKIKGFEANCLKVQQMSKPIVIKITKKLNTSNVASKISCTLDNDLIELQSCLEKSDRKFKFFENLPNESNGIRVYELFLNNQNNGTSYFAFNIKYNSSKVPPSSQTNTYINLKITDGKDFDINFKIEKKNHKWASGAGLNSTYKPIKTANREIARPDSRLISHKNLASNPYASVNPMAIISCSQPNYSIPIQQVSFLNFNKPTLTNEESLLPNFAQVVSGTTSQHSTEEFIVVDALLELEHVRFKPNL